jgi:hypothetical protein
MEANLVSSETVSDDQVLEGTSEAKSASSNGNSEADIENEVDDEVPPLYYSISSYGADYSIDGLVKRLNQGEIIIPKFQRSYIWTIEQASRLVESFLLGLPVPGVFLAQETGTKQLIVIDGQQRLKSLQYFYNGQFPENSDSDRYIPFALSGKISSYFLGKTYETLSAVDQQRLDYSIISATIIRQEGGTEENNGQAVIYHIFERLNAGGSQLYAQEVRAGAYYGKFNELLCELNEDEKWQKIVQGKKSAARPDPSKRMKDQELILRFLALYFDLHNYRGSMKDFLNSFIETHRSLDKNYTDFQMRVVFTRTVNLVYASIGEKAFRPRRGLHAAVFDAVMVALAKQLDKRPIQDLEALKEAYENLLSSEEFQRVSIDSKQTTSSENVRKRIELATLAFENVP